MRKRITMKYRINKPIWIVFMILLFGYGYVEKTYFKTSLPTNTVILAKCTDGDTAHFIINGIDNAVRFLAIDTPETVKPNAPVQLFGKEASEYTCAALQNAKEIRLEYEPSNETDKYDRKLAWVFVDNQLLQEALVLNGLAKVDYLYGDYKYTGLLKKAELEAKGNNQGIWENN